jgi:hypothetical protein
MPKATFCHLEGRQINIAEALRLREATKTPPDFRCAVCSEHVRPHQRGTTGQAAHFEHRTKNPLCSLSQL